MSTVHSLKTKKTITRNSVMRKWNTVPAKKSPDFAPLPNWARRFEETTGQAMEKYLTGQRRIEAVFTNNQAAFLASLGSTPQELYDFVEDWCAYGAPSFRTALRITEVRAEYFLLEQQGRRSSKVMTPDSMPSKEAELGGFVWLPRLIAKAKAKLRGEMPANLMFGCRWDRAFLNDVGVGPAEFLRVVWSAGDNDDRILEYVRVCAQFQGVQE